LRHGRAAAALADGDAIARAILRARHGLVDEHDAACNGAVGRGLERGHVGKTHDLCGEAAGGRRGRAAQRGGHHRTFTARRDDVCFLTQRIPIRDRERLYAHVAEALLAQHSHSPVACPRLGSGAGQTRADFRDEVFDDVPGAIALERRRLQPRHGALLLGADRGDGRGSRLLCVRR
jgi:hypothetical protein